MEKVVGGDLVAAMLADEGVDTVFGIVDGTYLGLLAGLEKHGIRLVAPRHETSAAHMAGAYARTTGKLGVCIASNGPGVANVLPGVAVENAEGNRVLLITSSRRQGITYPDRGGTYQYFDQVAVTRPMTRWAGTAPSVDRIPEMMRRAFRSAWHGRPGVVHVDVPENVLNSPWEIAGGWRSEPGGYRRVHPVTAPPDLVERAAAMLMESERPLIHAGSGVIHAGAFDALQRAAEALAAPVVTSWGARSVVPDTHPLVLPVPAIEVVNGARSSADVVLVVGSRVGETDWWGKPPYWGRPEEQRVIQVDLDEDVLGVNRRTSMAVHADAGTFLEALTEAVKRGGSELSDARKRWAADLTGRRDEALKELAAVLDHDSEGVSSAHVASEARKVFDDDAIVVIDGGNTAVWANFFHEVRHPNTILSTFKFGMLGAGSGQALGAKAAMPNRQVYCITGDGAMAFHAQEVETAVRQKLPVIWLVLADRQWGMVKLTQQVGLPSIRQEMGSEAEGTIAADLEEIAFDELARAMGAHGERVRKNDELEPAIRRAIDSERPAVIHVDVDPGLHLFAPGLQTFKDMHQEPAG